MEEISLYGAGGKPNWFWELNPSGTVPVMVAADAVYPDSDLILQAIVDGTVDPNNPLCGDSQSIKEWRQAVNQMLPIGKKAVLGGDKAKLAKLLQTSMESRLTDTPYLAGSSVSVADCHAFPFLWRLDQEFGLAGGLDCPKLGAWVQTCSKLPTFRKTIQSSWWWWW